MMAKVNLVTLLSGDEFAALLSREYEPKQYAGFVFGTGNGVEDGAVQLSFIDGESPIPIP